jgi:hypothetical protein
MTRNPSAVLSLPLSQESWRDAVRSFIAAEKRDIFEIEVSVTRSGDRIVALDSWMSGSRSAISMAEGIVDWIELRWEIAGAQDLEATISVWPKPYETELPRWKDENQSNDKVRIASRRQTNSQLKDERRSFFNIWRIRDYYMNAFGLRLRS